ncbi:MAG: hypothetical protein A2W01_01850 [Candidatus Solincola sediminis]|nr:MAG: hypothetical protein A2W01_01850 [Candidatus Solincola sediminis]
MQKKNRYRDRLRIICAVSFSIMVLLALNFVQPLSAEAATEETRVAAVPMNFYFGNLHSHTSYSDGTGTPAQAFTWARDTAGLDFYAISDHAESLNETEWQDMGVQADSFNSSGQFTAFRGFEWSSGTYGHSVVLNTAAFTNSIITSALDAFYNWIDQNNAVAQFNHPGREPNMFNTFQYDADVADNMCLVETGNKNTGNNDGDFYNAYITALDKGWKLAPTNNQDNHTLVTNSHRTVIPAPELTRSALLNAILARRVYSSDDPNMKVSFKYGDSWMGSEIESVSGRIQLDVAIEDDESIASVELITSGGQVAASLNFEAGAGSHQISWRPLVHTSVDTYYFLKVTERDELHDEAGEYQIALTAPIWVDVTGTLSNLGEGCTAGGFETWVLMENPAAVEAHATLVFLTENGEVAGPQVTIAPRSRASVNAGNYVTSYDVSSEVSSDVPIVVERSVYWGNRQGGTCSGAV